MRHKENERGGSGAYNQQTSNTQQHEQITDTGEGRKMTCSIHVEFKMAFE